MEFIKQQAELEQLVHDILKEARQQGADQAEVSVSAEEGLGVSVRKGDLKLWSSIKIAGLVSRFSLASVVVQRVLQTAV